MIIRVRCKKCGADTRLSLVNLSYDGLFRCWKCKQSHIFVVENDEIKYLELLNNEKSSKQLELDL